MPHVLLGELSAFWSEVATKTGAGILVLLVSTVASFVLGRMWGRYRARKQWEAKEFLGQEVVARGWYRRSPGPRIELRDVVATDGRKARSFQWIAAYAVSGLMVLAGVVVMLFGVAA